MARGIIYIMTTVVDGLIKIGKTQADQFENRMRALENNGYKNVTGLKRRFAIEVDDYDAKEALLHNIFDRSRIPNTELFALNVDLGVQLLSALEGNQIYPKPEVQSKEEIFDEATERIAESRIPNGIYYLKRTIRDYDGKTINAKMEIKNGDYIVLAGSDICPISVGVSKKLQDRRNRAAIKNNKLMNDESFTSSTTAAQFVLGRSENGRLRWKNKNGTPLSDFITDDIPEE